MSEPTTQEQRSIGGWAALALCAVAAAVYYPLAKFAPGWWRGSRLTDMDPPFDLAWLHNLLAWLAQWVGGLLLWVFVAMAVLLPVVAAFTRGFRTGAPVVEPLIGGTVMTAYAALVAIPAVAVAWFLCTQIAYLIAPYLGMFHGEYHPAVP